MVMAHEEPCLMLTRPAYCIQTERASYSHTHCYQDCMKSSASCNRCGNRHTISGLYIIDFPPLCYNQVKLQRGLPTQTVPLEANTNTLLIYRMRTTVGATHIPVERLYKQTTPSPFQSSGCLPFSPIRGRTYFPFAPLLHIELFIAQRVYSAFPLLVDVSLDFSNSRSLSCIQRQQRKHGQKCLCSVCADLFCTLST